MIIHKVCKHQFLCVNNNRGMAALLTVVIIAAATLIMAFNASLLGLGELDMGYTSQKGAEASSIADGCVEEAMRRLRLDSNYSGGTLNIGSGSCIIGIVADGNNRTITVTGTAQEFHKKIQATATLSGSDTALNTWQEISE
ncbi:MAG: hypothetical protein ABIA02_02420 [Candidatus Falkowbacteria bacterium]